MRRTSKKSIIEASHNYRNRKAWLDLVNLEERLENKEDYERLPLNWTPPKRDKDIKVGWYNFFTRTVISIMP